MPAYRTQDACAPNCALQRAGKMPAYRTQDACAPRLRALALSRGVEVIQHHVNQDPGD